MRPRRYENRGRAPKDQDAIVQVIWANGELAKHTYAVKQLKWERRGQPYDIDIYWRADGLGETEEEKAA